MFMHPYTHPRLCNIKVIVNNSLKNIISAENKIKTTYNLLKKILLDAGKNDIDYLQARSVISVPKRYAVQDTRYAKLDTILSIPTL